MAMRNDLRSDLGDVRIGFAMTPENVPNDLGWVPPEPDDEDFAASKRCATIVEQLHRSPEEFLGSYIRFELVAFDTETTEPVAGSDDLEALTRLLHEQYGDIGLYRYAIHRNPVRLNTPDANLV